MLMSTHASKGQEDVTFEQDFVIFDLRDWDLLDGEVLGLEI